MPPDTAASTASRLCQGRSPHDFRSSRVASSNVRQAVALSVALTSCPLVGFGLFPVRLGMQLPSVLGSLPRHLRKVTVPEALLQLGRLLVQFLGVAMGCKLTCLRPHSPVPCPWHPGWFFPTVPTHSVPGGSACGSRANLNTARLARRGTPRPAYRRRQRRMRPAGSRGLQQSVDGHKHPSRIRGHTHHLGWPRSLQVWCGRGRHQHERKPSVVGMDAVSVQQVDAAVGAATHRQVRRASEHQELGGAGQGAAALAQQQASAKRRRTPTAPQHSVPPAAARMLGRSPPMPAPSSTSKMMAMAPPA